MRPRKLNYLTEAKASPAQVMPDYWYGLKSSDRHSEVVLWYKLRSSLLDTVQERLKAFQNLSREQNTSESRLSQNPHWKKRDRAVLTPQAKNTHPTLQYCSFPQTSITWQQAGSNPPRARTAFIFTFVYNMNSRLFKYC